MQTDMVADDYSQAWMDWLAALGRSPSSRRSWHAAPAQKWQDTWSLRRAGAHRRAARPQQADRQFADEAWNQWPFNVYARSLRQHGRLVERGAA